MSKIPPEHENRLGVLLYVDTNFLPLERSQSRIRLWHMHSAGWISIQRTDVLGTELAEGTELPAELTQQAMAMVESHGPGIVDHSRVDAMGPRKRPGLVAHRESRKGDLPNHDLASLRSNRHPFRDVMHVAWAIRYGGGGFVTEEKRLLRRVGNVDIGIWTPDEALAIVKRRWARHQARMR